MSEIVYRKIVCPHKYYPFDNSRQMWRFEVLCDGEQIGFTDYFIEDDWLHYVIYWMAPQARNHEAICDFIRQGYLAEPEFNKSFWWNTPRVMKEYFEMIAKERPDITFVASGEIKEVRNTTL